jgi:hypothetical protein
MPGQWLILIVTDWKWGLFVNCYKMQIVGTMPLTNHMENLLFCNSTVLSF